MGVIKRTFVLDFKESTGHILTAPKLLYTVGINAAAESSQAYIATLREIAEKDHCCSENDEFIFTPLVTAGCAPKYWKFLDRLTKDSQT